MIEDSVKTCSGDLIAQQWGWLAMAMLALFADACVALFGCKATIRRPRPMIAGETIVT